MKYYPIYLDVDHQPVLVVGGGDVGTRKVLTLLECGASVTLVSPDATQKLIRLANTGQIEWKPRKYRASDLTRVFLVIGAANDEAVNRQISTRARQINLLCNIADKPEACNFILPSIVKRGDLLIAISTSGASPAYAKHLRKELEKQFGDEYAEFLTLMGAVRKKLLSVAHAPEAHKPLFESLVQNDLIHLIRSGDRQGVNALLVKTFGHGFEFDTIMKDTQKASRRGDCDDNP